MPFHTLGDIQTAGEYLVYAIRTMYAPRAPAHRRPRAQPGRHVDALGPAVLARHPRDGRRRHRHGRLEPRHDRAAGCVPRPPRCPPAVWQQGAERAFHRRRSTATPRPSAASPTPRSSRTPTRSCSRTRPTPPRPRRCTPAPDAITNVSTQDICPLDVDEHLYVGTVDPVPYALVDRRAEPHRPGRSRDASTARCARRPTSPASIPTTANFYLQQLEAVPGLLGVAAPVNTVGAPEVKAEPKLRCYVYAAGC